MNLAKIIASTAFTGFSPIAPGTVGAGIAVVAMGFIPPVNPLVMAGIIVLFFFIGLWSSTRAESAWGHDAGRINFDEVVGMMITLFALPKGMLVYAAGFFLFRLFDIVKPYPAGVSQRLAGGWGVMIDDVIAGLYANFLLQIIGRIWIF